MYQKTGVEVETPLLATKLNVPPTRPHIVSRPRLLEKLEENLNFNLVLVSAPAGFGKSTLLSEWTRSSQLKVGTAWVSLDEGDNDPIRFWDYFITAIQTLQPSCGEKILPWLHSSQPPSADSMLTALINELSAVKNDFVIVLDDYHLITSQQIHAGIIYFIEHIPPHVHLVIASRADPPLPLARFRGKDMMLELHTDDLRFTADETTSLMKALKTPALTAKDITALDERTEGWAVGLKMAALSMKGSKDITGFVADFTGSQRYIMDYLMEEVLKKQSQETREFLMKTSVLETLNNPLCSFITGRKDSQEILFNLERDHLFIVPLDESRQWYRYEHLFADLLRHQCGSVYGMEQVAALHRQASQWYEENDFPDEAIHHALEAKDWQRVMVLVDINYEVRRKRGEYNTLIGWFQAIPEEILREYLRLYSHYASLLAATGQAEATEVALNYLEALSLDDASRGEVTFTRGIVLRHHGDRRCIELFENAFSLLPPDEVAMRCRVAASIAHVRQRYNDFQEAEKWATTACELGQQAGDILSVRMAMGQIGIINSYQGKLKRAIEIYKKANELARHTAWLDQSYDMLCMNLYYLNDLEASAENARLAIEGYEKSGENTGMITAFRFQAEICLARGDEVEADALMTKLDEASRHPSIDSTWYASYIAARVRYAIQRNNIEEASTWGEQLPDLASIMLADRPITARLLLAEGKREPAARLLREMYEKVIQLGATIMVIRVRIYQALAADNDDQALEFLTEALTMAEPERIIRLFVDEGTLLKPLLEKALVRQITPNFTRKLLDIIEEEEQYRQAKKRTSTSALPGLLSERELEVTRLLATDVSNQYIADQLCVSLGTVKTHVHHIIEKLEVKDRRQAVQRAKELKLL
jgi:LuxR family maltose regulon positive regulatory protein